jgi:hypothetical protein
LKKTTLLLKSWWQALLQRPSRLNKQTEKNDMEQTERIKQMEHNLERASQAVMRLSAALDEYQEAQKAIQELSAYYGGDTWKQDFDDDRQGLLPQDLKRGVLSEDGIWNLLEDCRELNTRLAKADFHVG